MRRRLVPCSALLLALVGCGPSLPDETPLGEGPLAKAEIAAREKAEREAEAKSKAGDAQAPVPPPPGATAEAEPPKPPPEPEADKPAKEPPPKADKSDKSAGKGDGKKAAAAAVTYAGEYVGSDSSTYKISGMERSEKDDKARTRVDAGKDGQLSITFIDSSNGKDICTLKAKATGKSATFAAGQKCWAGAGMSGVLTSGTASFEDKKLVIDAKFDIEIGEGDMKSSGELHYHFEGNRK